MSPHDLSRQYEAPPTDEPFSVSLTTKEVEIRYHKYGHLHWNVMIGPQARSSAPTLEEAIIRAALKHQQHHSHDPEYAHIYVAKPTAP